MSDVILHHYPMSPFAEKVRLMLGAKKFAWKSVIIPQIMPKPDVVALTGGYRKTPVLQIGADIYCDTGLIARKLDALAPSPAFFPAMHAAAIHALCQWADSQLFGIAVVHVFQPEVVAASFSTKEAMQAFVTDRAALRQGAQMRRMPIEEARPALTRFLLELEAQVGDGRRYLFGAEPTAADFSVYHTLWFLRVRPLLTPIFEPYAQVRGWLDRMAAIGHGVHSEISSAQAIDIANQSEAAKLPQESDDARFAPGDHVEVLPTDYGFDPVAGELLACNLREIAVRRRDPRAGVVVVHFPRLNYEIRKTAAN